MMRWTKAGRTAREDITIWMTTVLIGRYIPGKLATWAGRIYAYRNDPVSKVQVSFCLLLDMAGTMIGACLLVLIAGTLSSDATFAQYRLPTIAAALSLAAMVHPVPLGLGLDLLARLTGREHVPVLFGYGRTMAIVLMLTAVWCLLGAGVVALASAVTELPRDLWLFVVTAFAVSHVAGVLAIFAPGGLGVREGTFALILSTVLPVGVASLVALASGVWIVGSELTMLGGLIVARQLPETKPEARGETTA